MKIDKAKEIIAKELNYKDWETCINDQPNYKIEGIMDKVAERYHSLMSEAKPISSENIKIGTKLIAIDECKMEFGDGNALIIGKSYKVNNIINNYIVIKSELCNVHEFEITELNEFFKISPILKEPNVLQEILENKFKFKYIPQLGIEAWSKRYNGFVLYIVKTKKDDLYIAGIKVHETEISIPGFVDEKWISVFHEENK